MKPLEKAKPLPGDSEKLFKDILALWDQGAPEIRALFKTTADRGDVMISLHQYIRDEVEGSELFINDLYQVAVRRREEWIHISIKRLDRKSIHDWRDLQEIKNQILGPEIEAVELYPAESRLVDGANQYHLWASPDPRHKFPFGFQTRWVSTTRIGKSEQRPFNENSELFEGA